MGLKICTCPLSTAIVSLLLIMTDKLFRPVAALEITDVTHLPSQLLGSLPTSSSPLTSSSPERDIAAWEDIFRSRPNDEWRSVWHQERHRRCYSELLSHMDWVCEKDIYKAKEPLRKAALVMRRRRRSIGNPDGPTLEKFNPHDWMASTGRLSGRRQRSKRGILDECCHASVGCSWEEYAEYCPANMRVRV